MPFPSPPPPPPPPFSSAAITPPPSPNPNPPPLPPPPAALPNPALMRWPEYYSYILSAIRNQVEYYFSSENLITDVYLRNQMDEHGWVDVGLISEFNRVKRLTGDVNVDVVVEAMMISRAVELRFDGKVIRKRGDWARWLIPPPHYLRRDVVGIFH